MSRRYVGAVLSSTRTTSSGTKYTGACPGVWSTAHQLHAKGASIWPKGQTIPDAPIIGTATGGNAQVSIAFTTPVDTGGQTISSYTVTSSPGSFTGTGSSSPITVTGLSNGTSYTFTVTATNPSGTGAASSASNSVTPSAQLQANFDGIKIYYKHNHGDAVRAIISWSTDGNNFTQIGTVGDWSNGEESEKSTTFTASGRKRYWRVLLTDPNDGNIGGQSDEIREVTWRASGIYVTDKSITALTSSGITGTLSTVYDNNTTTGTTGVQEGCWVKFDFGD